MSSDLIDRHTERWVMDHVFVKCNISLSLRKYKKPDEFHVVDVLHGETRKILARSVNNLATWKACLRNYCKKNNEEIDTGLYSNIMLRKQIYEEYLLHKSKSPYLFIANSDDLQKLRDMIFFSAVFRTTEQRYAERRIADPEARQYVARLLAQRDNNEGMSRAVGHARKHGEDVQEAIEGAYRSGLERIDGPIEWLEPLPTLPEGTTHALSWYQF